MWSFSDKAAFNAYYPSILFMWEKKYVAWAFFKVS